MEAGFVAIFLKNKRICKVREHRLAAVNFEAKCERENIRELF
jgi:hypothetical protein